MSALSWVSSHLSACLSVSFESGVKEGCRSGEGGPSHIIQKFRIRLCIPERINSCSSYSDLPGQILLGLIQSFTHGRALDPASRRLEIYLALTPSSPGLPNLGVRDPGKEVIPTYPNAPGLILDPRCINNFSSYFRCAELSAGSGVCQVKDPPSFSHPISPIPQKLDMPHPGRLIVTPFPLLQHRI